ncbi:MAG: hypothetical protein HZA92_02800 [Verrucomicrobia bacterium]|nr:hypothetical protein [Verrucomicrobiota bacterium]
MRVTGTMFSESLVGQLSRLSNRQNRLQEQAATGQRISQPEDDPGAMRRVLDLQAEARTVEQHRKNTAALKEQATVSYSAMSALRRISDRAGEIAVLADGTRSPADLRNYASEVTQLIQQAAQLANTKHRGDYVFAGTRNDQPAFAVSTSSGGQVTAVTYQGNASVAAAEVSAGSTVSAQVAGANTSGSGPRGLFTDSGAGADFFNHLIALQNNLLAGNAAAVNGTDLPALQRDEDNFLFHIAQNGAVQARLEVTDSLAASRSLSVEKLISGEADADLAQTLVRLNETQNAYRAALQTGGSILNQSLLDYLR